MEKKKNYMKAKGEARLGKEWDSDCSSSDSGDEGLAASAFNKSSLFPNECHTCLMAKEKKVCIRYTPKYTSSSDEESSDDEDKISPATTAPTNNMSLHQKPTYYFFRYVWHEARKE